MKKFAHGVYGLAPVLCLILLHIHNQCSQTADVELEPNYVMFLFLVLMGAVLAAAVYTYPLLSGRYQVLVSAIWIVVLPVLYISYMTGKFILPAFLMPIVYSLGRLEMLFDFLVGGYLFTLITGLLKMKDGK